MKGGAWSPLSSEARSLIASQERDGLAWGYVRLSDGEAAQLGAFGVAQRPPDLLAVLDDVPVARPDPAQADFGF